MSISRLTLVILIALSSSLWVGWNRMQCVRLQTEAAEARQERARLQVSIHQSKESLSKTQSSVRAVQEETMQMGGTIQAAGQPEAKLRVSEDPRWLNEPANSAEWDPSSPYIWMPKSKLNGLRIPTFKNDGDLTPTWGEILGMPAEEHAALNKDLRELVGEYQRQVVASTRETKEHAPMIAEAEGEKFSVEFQMPLETRTAYKHAFRAILVEHLGEDRFNVMSEAGSGYIEDMFGPDNDEQPSRISAGKNKEGKYVLTIRQAGHDSSYGGLSEILGYLPEHLRPIFAGRGFK